MLFLQLGQNIMYLSIFWYYPIHVLLHFTFAKPIQIFKELNYLNVLNITEMSSCKNILLCEKNQVFPSKNLFHCLENDHIFGLVKFNILNTTNGKNLYFVILLCWRLYLSILSSFNFPKASNSKTVIKKQN